MLSLKFASSALGCVPGAWIFTCSWGMGERVHAALALELGEPRCCCAGCCARGLRWHSTLPSAWVGHPACIRPNRSVYPALPTRVSLGPATPPPCSPGMLNGAKGVANDACLYGEETVIRLLNESVQGDTGAKVCNGSNVQRQAGVPCWRAVVHAWSFEAAVLWRLRQRLTPSQHPGLPHPSSLQVQSALRYYREHCDAGEGCVRDSKSKAA